SVLIRQHKLAHVKPHPHWLPGRDTGAAPTNTLVHVPAGTVHLGRNIDCAPYGWDNEFGRHHAEVAAFDASRYLVSNQEFLPFVEADGYQQPDYWDEEGRQWREFTQASHPAFWRRSGEDWLLRLLTE